MKNIIKKRLEYLRQEIKAERISYGEIAELQSLVAYIDPNDVELLQWAVDEEKDELEKELDEEELNKTMDKCRNENWD